MEDILSNLPKTDIRLGIKLALKLSFILSRQLTPNRYLDRYWDRNRPPTSPQIVQKKPQAAVNHVRNGRGPIGRGAGGFEGVL